MLRRTDRGLAALAVLVLLGPVRAGAEPGHPPVVISQVYGGGGNVGANYTHDFIELFNQGDVPVSLDEWSVQYATSSGSSWTRTFLSGTIRPGGRHLVQQAGGSGGTISLPLPDDEGTVQMAAASGKVALVAGTGILPCGSACADAEWVVDLVGYGSANDHEGAGPAPTLSNTLAAIRHGDGCTDTNDNAADFIAGAPDPRNSSAEATPCGGEAPDPDPSPDPSPSPEPDPSPEPSPDPSPSPGPDPGCGDATAPTLAVRASPAVLWPPNHRRVEVEMEVTVVDGTDPSPLVRLLSASSSEADSGTGPGDRGEDLVVMDDRTVLARAERSGNGPGRTYALTYEAVDVCGNASVASAEVVVPHDLGKG